MKKAKDYAKMFNDVLENSTDLDELEEVLNKILKCFLSEIHELINTRKAQSNSAILAIFNEQEQKWRSFARQTGLGLDGFADAVKAVYPEIYSHWKKEEVWQERFTECFDNIDEKSLV